MRAFALLLVWLATLVPVWAGATASTLSAPAITHRAWLDDPGNELSARQALAKSWTPYHAALARGFPSGATWVRLKVDPGRPASMSGTTIPDPRVVLVIQPPQLDEIVVFRSDRPDQPLVVVGDTVLPPSGQPRSLSHIVVVPDATEPFELLLRVRSRSTHLVNVEVLRWDEARDHDTRDLLGIVAYTVFIAVIVLWAAWAWLAQRDALLVLFFAHQCSAMLLGMTLLGLMRWWTVPWLLTPSTVDVLTAVAIPLYTGFGVLFHVRFLRDVGARAVDRTWLPLLLVPQLAGLVLMVLGFRQAAVQTVQASVPLLLPLLTLVAWRCRAEVNGEPVVGGRWRRAYLVGTYAVMTALSLPQSLSVVGLRSAGSSNFGWFMVSSVTGAVLMMGLLRYRAVQLEARRRGLAQELSEARQLAELQKARATEQSELVTMLTHELKTPLSVVILALGRGDRGTPTVTRALRAVRSMQDVINRCAQIAHFDDRSGGGVVSSATMEPLDLGLVVQEAAALQTQPGRIELRVPAGLPRCQTDPKLLRVIVGNLLENALKYSPPEAAVQLTVAMAARDGREGVTLRVSNPVGRAGRPEVGQVFQKYYRSAHARYRSGSGLGLYLSQRLAVGLGGQLVLVEDEDVSFELWLPL